jgi:predicted metal-dependent phosphoesterase TrpH
VIRSHPNYIPLICYIIITDRMRLDLHIHSQYSPDSQSSIEAILKQAQEAGLDGIAITDHNSIQSFFEASKLAEDLELDLIVVPGAEISTSQGHLITLGTPNLVPSGLPADETIEHANDNGGIVVAPHPYAFFRKGINNLQTIRLDAVETFNSKNLFRFSNYLANRSARKLNLGMTGGSDSHKVETIGFGYTEVNIADGADVEQILQAIKSCRSQAKGRVSPRLRLITYSLKARMGSYKNSR